jgi:hypothetical protein
MVDVRKAAGKGIEGLEDDPPLYHFDRSNLRSARVTAYGELPLAFEVNRGQTDPRVKFCARSSGYGLFFTATQAILYLRQPSCVDCEKDFSCESSTNAVKDAVPTGAAVTIGLMAPTLALR